MPRGRLPPRCAPCTRHPRAPRRGAGWAGRELGCRPGATTTPTARLPSPSAADRPADSGGRGMRVPPATRGVPGAEPGPATARVRSGSPSPPADTRSAASSGGPGPGAIEGRRAAPAVLARRGPQAGARLSDARPPTHRAGAGANADEGRLGAAGSGGSRGGGSNWRGDGSGGIRLRTWRPTRPAPSAAASAPPPPAAGPRCARALAHPPRPRVPTATASRSALPAAPRRPAHARRREAVPAPFPLAPPREPRPACARLRRVSPPPSPSSNQGWSRALIDSGPLPAPPRSNGRGTPALPSGRERVLCVSVSGHGVRRRAASFCVTGSCPSPGTAPARVVLAAGAARPQARPEAAVRTDGERVAARCPSGVPRLTAREMEASHRDPPEPAGPAPPGTPCVWPGFPAGRLGRHRRSQLVLLSVGTCRTVTPNPP